MNSTDRDTIKEVFITNLAVKKREKAIVFTDCKRGRLNEIAKLFTETGKNFTTDINLVSFRRTDSHGSEPPEELWLAVFGSNIFNELKKNKILDAIIKKRVTERDQKETERVVRRFKEEAVKVVVALSYHSTSHTSFRDLLTRLCGTRYASMPIFDESMLRTAMRVDLKKMYKRTEKIAGRVKKCDFIEIITPNGTSLTLKKGDREVRTDTGIIRKPGEFSNLPAGEVYLAPLEGTANGRLVLEWAPTRKLRSRITLNIEKGKVQSVEGSERYTVYLKEMLSKRPENANIAELGIGTNDMASRLDNILESEKIFGTIHIALGDNSSFGGKVRTPFHQDFLFFKPTVTLIHSNKVRKLLLKDGKMVR